MLNIVSRNIVDHYYMLPSPSGGSHEKILRDKVDAFFSSVSICTNIYMLNHAQSDADGELLRKLASSSSTSYPLVSLARLRSFTSCPGWYLQDLWLSLSRSVRRPCHLFGSNKYQHCVASVSPRSGSGSHSTSTMPLGASFLALVLSSWPSRPRSVAPSAILMTVHGHQIGTCNPRYQCNVRGRNGRHPLSRWGSRLGFPILC